MKKMQTAIFRLIMLIIIAIIGGTIAYTFYFNYQKNHQIIPPRVTNVSVIQVSNQTFQGNIQNSGFIQTSISSNLNILASGKVANIFVKPGQQVTKGELILQLDVKAQEAQLKAQEAKINAALLNYKGLQAVYKEGGASLISLEQAEANYNQLLSSIKALQEQLDNSKIIAPFSGTLGAINVSIGDIVQAGQPLASIVPNANSKLTPYINLGITSNIINNLSIGNKAIALDENGNVIGNGKITAIDDNISPITGLAQIRVSFTNNSKLTEGRFVKVLINTNPQPNVIVIPDIAVNYTIYGQTVYTLVPLSKQDEIKLIPYINQNTTTSESRQELIKHLFKIKETFITSHVHVNNIALVTSGLKSGQIIVTNSNSIQDGSFVRVIPGYGIGIPNTFTLPKIAIPKQNANLNNNSNNYLYKE